MAQEIQVPQDFALLPSNPASPPAGYIRFFMKTDGKVYIKDSSGTVTELAAASGGGLSQAQVLARMI